MPRYTRVDVARLLGEYYSRKFGGHVWSYFDTSRRAYVIRGEGLPARSKRLRAMYPNGWSLLDYVTPTHARQLIGG